MTPAKSIHLKVIEMFARFGVASIALTLSFYGSKALAADPAPAAPVVIQPADAKQYIEGLNGAVDADKKTAVLQGFIDQSCVSKIRLDASGIPKDNRIVFGMFDLGGGLDCLKSTTEKCKDHSKCLSFDQADANSKHRLLRPFKTWVPLDQTPDSKMRIALANDGHLGQGDADRRKLEASAACDCDVKVAPSAEPMQGAQKKNVKDLRDALTAAAKPKPGESDEDSGDDDEPAVKALPGPRHAQVPPGLRHVPTEMEMGMQFQQDMYPFVSSMAQQDQSNLSLQTFLTQQTQAEVASIQQLRPNNFTLGNTMTYPGAVDYNAIYAQSLQQSQLLGTPVLPQLTGPSPNSVLMYQMAR